MQQSRERNLRDRHALRVGVLRAFGAGIAAQVGKRASVYATANWQTSLGGAHQRTIMGDAGVRWAW